MDRNKNKSVVLEKDLDHLLRTAIDIGLHKAAETPYAMIDMHDIVIDLDLIKLLERQSKLAGASLVRTQTIFMEPVKYLMIGKEASLRVMIDKTLMHRRIDRRESDILSSVGKYGLEPVSLIIGIRKNQNTVAIGKER